MTNNDSLHKEIDLIQGIISRMANNTFLLKGWLVSLIAIIIALTKDSIIVTGSIYFCILLLLLVIAFWYLDAFFLHKEQCFRKLYDWVIENRKNTDDYLFNLDYTRFEKQVYGILRIMFSKTLIVFYGMIFTILLLLTIYKGVHCGQ
jgi:hypothetical protein